MVVFAEDFSRTREGHARERRNSRRQRRIIRGLALNFTLQRYLALQKTDCETVAPRSFDLNAPRKETRRNDVFAESMSLATLLRVPLYIYFAIHLASAHVYMYIYIRHGTFPAIFKMKCSNNRVF